MFILFLSRTHCNKIENQIIQLPSYLFKDKSDGMSGGTQIVSIRIFFHIHIHIHIHHLSNYKRIHYLQYFFKFLDKYLWIYICMFKMKNNYIFNTYLKISYRNIRIYGKVPKCRQYVFQKVYWFSLLIIF